MQRFPRYAIYHDVGVGKVGTKAYWKKQCKRQVWVNYEHESETEIEYPNGKKNKSDRRFNYIT